MFFFQVLGQKRQRNNGDNDNATKTNESQKTGQHSRQHANMQIDALTIFSQIKYAISAENRMASVAPSPMLNLLNYAQLFPHSHEFC